MLRLLTVSLKAETDIVFARQRARHLADILGFDRQDQTRIATAVSEVARNAIEHGGGGIASFALTGTTPPQLLEIIVEDRGPGIADLKAVLEGQYRSQTGMGVGLTGARRLVDQFAVQSKPGEGTRVALRKLLPDTVPLKTKADLRGIVDRLLAEDGADPLRELKRQNQELLFSLEEVGRQRRELEVLNEELQDTNRGVVALYAELDEKAEHLRRADELKTRFLSNMSHEFRTPLNSILALSRLLLNRADGELTPEQERQVEFIRKGAQGLSELVNDLLDLAKVEAGKTEVKPTEFTVAELFGALRGMLRPLLVGDRVALVFEDVSPLPPMVTDEAKVSQVLRNFISNALKFTEAGEVRVSAALSGDGASVVFAVADTGIGIAPEYQGVIFREFSQLDTPLQRKVKGTGLGLPLSRRFAELLGGEVWLTSMPGRGSTFFARIPLCYRAEDAGAARAGEAAAQPAHDPARVPVLAIEDNGADLMVYESMLRQTRFELVTAKTLREAKRLLAEVRPGAIILDILLRGEDSWRLLADLKRDEALRDIPIVVATSVEDRAKAEHLGADAYAHKPVGRNWLLATLEALTSGTRPPRVLVIDDDEASRYILRHCLAEQPYLLEEAATGEAGLASARESVADLVLLDLGLPGISGFEVLDELKAEPRTADVPIIVVTSSKLNADDVARLKAARRVLPKAAITRESLVPIVTETMTSGPRP